MKRFAIALLVVLLLSVSCSPVSEGTLKPNNDYSVVPFSSGMDIEPIDGSVSKSMVGTYVVSVYGNLYQNYIVSLYQDGTVKAIGEGGTLSSTTELMSGTWSIPMDGKISIKIGTVLDYTEKPYDYDKWDQNRYMRIEDHRTSYYLYFTLFKKISECTMDTSIYSDQSKFAGLYAKSDDYGKVTGYRFLPDGTAYWYSSESVDGKGTKLSWMVSKTKVEMKLTEKGSYSDQTCSFAKVGDYILLNSTAYMVVNEK